MADTLRDLLEEDGENRALRSFLMQYGLPGLTAGAMRDHMKRSGWGAEYWPFFVSASNRDTHLTKGGAQVWIRHLLAMEVASRPTEVDEEELPAPAAWAVGKELFTCHDAIPFRLLPPIGQPEPLFTAEQYRQGQRDAVAADRARRGDINPEDAFVLYSAADVIDECGKVLVALKVRGIADRVIMPEITKAPR